MSQDPIDEEQKALDQKFNKLIKIFAVVGFLSALALCLAIGMSPTYAFGLPLILLADYDYEPLCEQLGLRELITQHQVIPIAKSASTLRCLISRRAVISSSVKLFKRHAGSSDMAIILSASCK